MSGSTADPSVERVRETVAARLNAVGQRLTANRQSLLDTLVAAPRPLTIPEILDDRPGLAQSSVYRNLVVLERSGVVSKVVTNNEWSRYELAEDLTGHHHHLICSSCGAVRDVDVPEPLEASIDAALSELAAQHGFTLDDHRLDLLGTCEACR
jgi:Fe2+ or Zn2+ uptake regulation protein